MKDEFCFVRGNEENIDDIIILLKELINLHKELAIEINLSFESIEKYRRSMLIELKDQETYNYLLIYKNNEPIAFGVGKKLLTPVIFNNHFHGYIPFIYIKTPFRNRGLGKKIFRNLENWFKEQNIYNIEVNVMEENNLAMAFYNRLGFKTISSRLRKQIGD